MTMAYRRTILSKPHNWLSKHYYIRSLEKIAHHIQGRVLDVGCGVKPYAFVIEPRAEEYIGLDLLPGPDGRYSLVTPSPEKEYLRLVAEKYMDIDRQEALKEDSPRDPITKESIARLPASKKADIFGRAENLPFPDESFDTVVSFQVIEHLPEPSLFFAEAFRVLKPKGKLIVSSPFQFGIHEDPGDYFRFAPGGLKYLAEKTGFNTLSIEPAGGFWTVWIIRFNYFLRHHTPCRLRFLLLPFFYLNQVFADFMDNIFSNYDRDTVGYTMLAEKGGLVNKEACF